MSLHLHKKYEKYKDEYLKLKRVEPKNINLYNKRVGNLRTLIKHNYFGEND